MLERGHYGLVLFEHETKDAAATKLLAEFLQTGRVVPFIVLTDQRMRKQSRKLFSGAWDCVEKSQLNGANLLRTMRCTLNLHSSQQQLKLAKTRPQAIPRGGAIRG